MPDGSHLGFTLFERKNIPMFIYSTIARLVIIIENVNAKAEYYYHFRYIYVVNKSKEG